MRVFSVLLAVFFGLLAFTWFDSTSKAGEDADVLGKFGDPIPGLTPTQIATFEFGRAIFVRRFTREEGLGPHFNASACSSCHEEPEVGGSSQRYRDFLLVARSTQDGRMEKTFSDCTEENEATQSSALCLPSVVLPHYGPKGTIAEPVAHAVEHPSVPAEADIIARRNAPPIFGIGLFRLVTDAEILSRADPEDLDGDGISGRVNRIAAEDDQIGRFGFKCQTASIEAFNRGALQNQMGITSDSTEVVRADMPEREPVDGPPGFLRELFGSKTAHAQVATPVDRIVDFDDVSDPEITRGELLALIFFQENLAAPRRGQITPSVSAGEEVFQRIGCADCHVTSLDTPIGKIYPYSDLLIHDLGPLNADGVVMAQATGSEFRTQPLWGLCQHTPFLHDGSAGTVEEAILKHGGEAQAATDSYAALSDEEHRFLHRFLESL
jgi:CxxC motif-containing protein (DUF1111 family)